MNQFTKSSYSRKSKAFLESIGAPTTPQESFNQIYIRTKLLLHAIYIPKEMSLDRDTGYRPPMGAGYENLTDYLMGFASLALKYLGHGLYALGERVFDSIRTKAEKTFLSYPSIMASWKSRVWKNSREIDGQRFDEYKAKVVPHAILIKRIQAVEAVHKALSSVSKIYNAPVTKDSEDWTTPECDKAINAMEKIGFNTSSLDMLANLSRQYANARRRQPMYLHGYTPKRILDIIVRCEKLAEYGNPKYIEAFKEQYFAHTEQLESDESTTSAEIMDHDDKTDKQKKDLKDQAHEERIRAARLWWLAHFLKAAYQITSDIIKDVEVLMKVTERTIANDPED